MFNFCVNHKTFNCFSRNTDHYSYRVMPKLTIGILGLGDIGEYVAKMCKALGMTVWGVGRREKSDRQDTVDHYTTISRLPEVLQSCDYVCNLLPSTPATKYLLSGRVLESGKDKRPVFINVGRGNVIDEKSLIYALDQGWISGAILDVCEVEPLPKESPLWKMPQVIITPHIAAISFPEEVNWTWAWKSEDQVTSCCNMVKI